VVELHLRSAIHLRWQITLLAMRDKRSLISASEVENYVFCARAWRFRAQGHEATALKAARDAGIEWHHEYGRTVANERRLRIAAKALLVTALFLCLLLLLYMVLR
jgi:hypothetical protein